MLRAKDGKEKAALEKLKIKFEDLKQDDCTLLRFLRARDLNVGKAEDMIRKAMIWRKEKNVESYLLFTPSKELLNDFPYRFTGFDYEGRPVVWFPWGKYDGRVWVEQGRKPEVVNLIYHILESVMKRLQESNSSQVVSIWGMEELTLRKMSHFETNRMVYTACQDMENYYPEIIHKIIVVNAPWIFTFGFNLIKPILSSHSLAKMQVYNTDKSTWLKVLEDVIPRDAIPREYLENELNSE